MCVCIRCCLAVIATAVIFMPQSEGFPIEPRPPNESQPELQKAEPEKTSTTPITENTTGNPIKENQNRLPGENGHSEKGVISEFSIAEVTKPVAAPPGEGNPNSGTSASSAASDHPQNAADKKTMVVVPQMNVASAQIVEPAPVSSSVQVEPGSGTTLQHPKVNKVIPQINAASSSPQTEPAKTSEHPKHDESGKETVPKVDVIVGEMIKPVAATTQVEPGHRAGTTTEADLASQAPKTGVKEEGPAASSAATEASQQLPPPSADHTHPNENKNEGQVKERDIPESTSDQPLTTVITPVHAIPLKGNSLADDNNKQKDPVKVLEDDGSKNTELPTDKKPNAYTITPNEFAKKTAVAHSEKLDEESKDQTPIATEDASGKQGNLEAQTVQPASTEALSPTSTDSPVLSDEKRLGKNLDISNKEQIKKTPEVTIEEISQNSSNAKGDINLRDLHEISEKIANNFKVFSNEVTLKWKERREKISWLSEASEVLQTYNDKISETEKYSHKCTAGDRQEYEKRKKKLNGILEQCEKTMQRKSWHELQVKTFETIRKIESIVKDAEAQINQIPKDEKHFNDRKLVIEEQAKRKLQDLDAESAKKTFSDLEADALRTDEDDYKKCIDSKEKEGAVLISDTRVLIMKIFNCGNVF